MVSRKAKSLLLAGLLAALTGCSALNQLKTQPAPAPTLPVQAPAAPQASLDERMEQLKSASKALDDALKASDKAAYKRAWDQLLDAADAALSHPEAWSLPSKALPLTLAAEQPDYRVYYREGYYQYLGEDPALKNLWVQWKEPGGTTRAQVLFRERGRYEHQARAAPCSCCCPAAPRLSWRPGACRGTPGSATRRPSPASPRPWGAWK